MLHEWHVLKKCVVSGYNYTRPEPKHHDNAHCTTYGKCDVITAQLDVFIMQSYHVLLVQSTMQHEWHVLKTCSVSDQSPSIMIMPILLRMGSVMLLPLNWMYLWCEVITTLRGSPPPIPPGLRTTCRHCHNDRVPLSLCVHSWWQALTMECPMRRQGTSGYSSFFLSTCWITSAV